MCQSLIDPFNVVPEMAKYNIGIYLIGDQKDILHCWLVNHLIYAIIESRGYRSCCLLFFLILDVLKMTRESV